ncbi:MAG: hypothetical protein LBV51_02080 [Acholeplasmatales bacterium]|jgi:NRPS condensation-like uncharacterized protein|nr:hypothetical protein [Acholeplasmatales bacterium]
MAKQWYRIDNAGTIFPLTRGKNDTSSFRLACLLKENASKDALKKAVSITLERFPSFKVKLKRGFFWFYLETNFLEPVILDESPILSRAVSLKEQNDYLFKVCVFEKRVSIEFYHALTDGMGGMEFFKAVLYNYFVCIGHKFVNSYSVLTSEIEELYEETKDSFLLNYDKTIKDYPKDTRAYKIKGFPFKTNFIGAFYIICNTASILSAAKKYNATLGEYISSLIILGIYNCYFKNDPNTKNRPIRITLPVNLRKYFNSRTLRNFVLFIRTSHLYNENIILEDVIKDVKNKFSTELTLPFLHRRLAQNMNFEKAFFIRIIPLFLKIPLVKIGYKIASDNVSTFSYSNLGKINVPLEFNDLVDRFEFLIPPSQTSPVNASSISFNNKTILTLTSRIIDRKIQSFVINQLIKDNVDLVIETNEMEVGV